MSDDETKRAEDLKELEWWRSQVATRVDGGLNPSMNLTGWRLAVVLAPTARSRHQMNRDLDRLREEVDKLKESRNGDPVRTTMMLTRSSGKATGTDAVLQQSTHDCLGWTEAEDYLSVLAEVQRHIRGIQDRINEPNPRPGTQIDLRSSRPDSVNNILATCWRMIGDVTGHHGRKLPPSE